MSTERKAMMFKIVIIGMVVTIFSWATLVGLLLLHYPKAPPYKPMFWCMGGLVAGCLPAVVQVTVWLVQTAMKV